ncbi:hypothetical protein F3G63_34855, partial [Pseudomonas aeruginosa]
DALSCLLFNVALDKCIRDSAIETTGNIYYKSAQVLGYADDIDVIGRSALAVESAYLALEASSLEAGLQVNADKTKFLRVSRDLREDTAHKNIGQHTFGSVNEFV